MEIAILVILILGYFGIAFENPLRIEKSAFALITGVLCWGCYALSGEDMHIVEGALKDSIDHIAEIVFFLWGAMTIVEIIDAHEGFSIITSRIKTRNKIKLLWIISILAFFFSAVLDNLTASIVMVALTTKLIADQKDRWFFVGMIVIAANAGGAWSPIGDVTTTMLWIGGQLTIGTIMKNLFLPSLVTLLVPLVIMTFRFRMNGQSSPHENLEGFSVSESYQVSNTQRYFMFFLGVAGLLFAPVFKLITGLPPFMGMLLSLGTVSLIAEAMHRGESLEARGHYAVKGALKKIDGTSMLFFIGILLAVAVLGAVGHLDTMGQFLEEKLGNVYSINLSIGLISSIIANVPLVAGIMGMYEVLPVTENMTEWQMLFVQDGVFWQFLAFCAGTGGSAIIFGSAAGVAAMGLQKINFFWYLKNITLLAVAGYLAGAGVFILMHLVK